MKKILVEPQCLICGKSVKVFVYPCDLEKWDHGNGVYVQDAFPYLNADEREMFISATCPTCWDEIFPPESEIDLDNDQS